MGDGGHSAHVESIIDAVARFDFAAMQQRLARAVTAVGARTFALELVPALLTDLGDRWGSGEFCPAQEHALSAVLRTVLGSLLVRCAPRADAPLIVLGTPRGERHEFGAMLAGVLAAEAGMRIAYLGCDLPDEQFALAATTLGARALALSAIALAREPLVDEVTAIRRSLPGSLLLIGGAAAEANRACLLGEAEVVTLDEFEGLVATELLVPAHPVP